MTRRKLLVRLDSAHDAIDTRVLLRHQKNVSHIIKWNPRREDTPELCTEGFAEGQVTDPRKGKGIALLTIRKQQVHEGNTYLFTKVIRRTQRTMNKHGQLLLVPETTIEGWWTNLDLPEKKIISLYQNHALSEQFHSEFKTDLDLERLPSGKFATNALVMACGTFAYNILRLYRSTWACLVSKITGAPSCQEAEAENSYSGIDLPGSPLNQKRSPVRLALQQALSCL